MVIDAQNAVQIFTGGGMSAILDDIESKVRAIKLDPSTAATTPVDAIMDGRVRHVRVVF